MHDDVIMHFRAIQPCAYITPCGARSWPSRSALEDFNRRKLGLAARASVVARAEVGGRGTSTSTYGIYYQYVRDT